MPAARVMIDRTVAGYVRRRRVVAAVRAMFFAVAVVAAWCLLACIADRFAGFNRPVRVAAASVAIVGGLALLRPAGRLLRRRFDAVAAAVEIETLHPALAGRLTTAVSLPVGGTSSQMLDVVTDEAAAVLPTRVSVSWRPVIAPLIVLAAVAAALVGSFRSVPLDMRGSFFRAIHPMSVLPPISITRLEMTSAPASVPTGQPLQISCTARPVDPATVFVHVSDDAGRTWCTLPMAADSIGSGKFSYTWAAVASDLRFFVTAGDATGPATTVVASAKPVVLEFRSRIEPPKYLHRPVANSTTVDGEVAVIEGSVMTIDVVCSRPVWRLRMTTNGHEGEIAPTANPSVVRFQITVHGDQLVNVQATGADGQLSEERFVQIRAQPDHPPTVRFVDPLEVALVSPTGTADAAFDAADDFGLTSVTIDSRVDERRHQLIVKPFDGSRLSVIVENPIDLHWLKLTPGDVVTIRLRARDGRDQASVSEVHYLLVVPDAPDPKDARRRADLEAAAEWIERAGVDPAAEENLSICLFRASVDAPSKAWGNYLTSLSGKPPGSVKTQVQMLLNADRAEELNRLQASVDWLDGRPAAVRNGMEHRAVRERITARMIAESARLGVTLSSPDATDKLGDIEQAADDLVSSQPMPAGAPIPSGPAMSAPRPPSIPVAGRRPGDSEVPGFEEADKLYFDRLKKTTGK